MGTNNAFTEATCDSFRAGSCKTNHKKSRNNVISLPEEEMKRSVPRGRNISRAGWADAKPMEVLVSALGNPAARSAISERTVRGLSALSAGIASVHAAYVLTVFVRIMASTVTPLIFRLPVRQISYCNQSKSSLNNKNFLRSLSMQTVNLLSN